jgi:hypothetical protein
MQTKLTVNQPGDQYEQEAARVADQVMRAAAPTSLQRKCGSCEENEGKLQRTVKGHGLMRAIEGGQTTSTAPPVVSEVVNSNTGRPLDSSARAFFEPRFGCDLAQVRVHTDARAAESARAVNALACTVGQNVIFGAGQYAPETAAGRRLLAHELTHVIQQQALPGAGEPRQLTRGESSTISVMRAGRVQLQAQDAGLPAPPLIPSPTTCPYDDKECRPEHSCCLPAPTIVVGKLLPDPEVTRRRQQVQEAINRSRPTYPLAAKNLQHWLDNTGRNVTMPGSVFQKPDSGFPAFLESKHRPAIEGGIRNRLALPASDPRSLQPPGVTRVLTWCDSMRASPQAAGTERDLSIALGGFTVKSWVAVRARPTPSGTSGLRGRREVEVLSWRVQICDRYKWFTAGVAPIPIPTAQLQQVPLPPDALQTMGSAGGITFIAVRDEWFKDLEASGGGRQYEVYSEVFDAPASIRSNFVL